jgi:hypothetical protein
MTTTIADGMSLPPSGWARLGSVEWVRRDAWRHIVNLLANLIQLPAPARGCFGWWASCTNISAQCWRKFRHRRPRSTPDVIEVLEYQPSSYVACSIAGDVSRLSLSPPFVLRVLGPTPIAFRDWELVCLRLGQEDVPDDDLPIFFDFLMNCGSEPKGVFGAKHGHPLRVARSCRLGNGAIHCAYKGAAALLWAPAIYPEFGRRTCRSGAQSERCVG